MVIPYIIIIATRLIIMATPYITLCAYGHTYIYIHYDQHS